MQFELETLRQRVWVVLASRHDHTRPGSGGQGGRSGPNLAYDAGRNPDRLLTTLTTLPEKAPVPADPWRHTLFLFPLLLVLAILMGCGGEQQPATGEPPAETEQLTLTSPVFEAGERIPTRYTCDGEDSPPPLTWQDVPTGVQSFALIMDDPDAPGRTWVHWVLYAIPPDVRQLPDGVPAPAGIQGTNSWDRTGYGGPCPPSGEHRYFFQLYALNTSLALAPGADKEALLTAMEGHVLAQGQLMGRYGDR